MSDLRGEIRARLAPARLAPTREAEIVEVLRQLLDDLGLARGREARGRQAGANFSTEIRHVRLLR